MIAGHFGFAAIVKARQPAVPLWALMLATVWLDIVFVPLYLAGVEYIDTVPGAVGSYGAGIIHADYTHSLLGAALLSALFGAVAAIRWVRRTAVVLGLVVFSHWMLDLIVHRADMPLLPGHIGGGPYFGFGLWRWAAPSIAAELVLVLLGVFLYWRTAERVVSAAGGGGRRRARLVATLLLLGGCAILGIDATS